MFPKRRMYPKFIEMHSGSLKTDLEDFWGEDPVQEMRACKEDWYEYAKEDLRIKARAYAWREADQLMLDCLDKEYFLAETEVYLDDDYIECDDPAALFDYQGAPYVVPAPPIQESKPEQAPPKPLPALFRYLGYNDVCYQGEFIIPQMKNPRGYPILDAIYAADKKLVVGEIGRNTTIEGNVIHRDTPKGTVYYRIETKTH